MEPDFELKRIYRTTVVVNAALLASLLVYALMVELIKSQFRPFPGLFISGPSIRTLRYVVFGAAIGAVLLTRLGWRALLKVKPGEEFRQLISRLSRTAVITATLGELPALFGFVLFLLTGFSRDFYILLFVSLFLEFMYFPRLNVWQELARERFPYRKVEGSSDHND